MKHVEPASIINSPQKRTRRQHALANQAKPRVNLIRPDRYSFSSESTIIIQKLLAQFTVYSLKLR